MSEIPDHIAKQVVQACHKLYKRELVANHDGNITVKLDSSSKLFIATPTAFSKGDVTEKDLLLVNEQGQVLRGVHKVFSEIQMHLAIYRVRPDAQCVVHAHPPTASGIALAHNQIGSLAIPEAVVSLGRHILTSSFISPTSIEISRLGGKVDEEFQKLLRESDAFLLPGNGAWTLGQDAVQTYYRMELVEHIAKQYASAMTFGGVKGIPENLMTELLQKRPKAKLVEKSYDLDREKLKKLVEDEVKNLFGQE